MKRRPNYLPAVEVLADQARRHGPQGQVTHVAVEHEDGCAHWSGAPCDCEPVVNVLGSRPIRPEVDSEN